MTSRRRNGYIIPDTPSGGWLFLTAAQSILSITLVALFLLAIRWRFRREYDLYMHRLRGTECLVVGVVPLGV